MRKIFNHISERSSAGIVLFALLAALILSASVHKAWAYFTTYATAKGGYIVELGDQTRVEEEFSNNEKRVKIINSTDSKPVYVRAIAFSGSKYPLTYSSEEDKEPKWNKGEGGYYYYSDFLPAGGETTNRLIVGIENFPKNDTNSPDFNPDDFNVIVVYETTPVLYRADGSPYADWTGEVDATTVTANN